MKFVAVISLVFVTSVSYAKDMHEFNHLLIEGVQKDIQTDNDQPFKIKEARRGPASVEADKEGTQIQETNKVEKNRQIGPNKW